MLGNPCFKHGHYWPLFSIVPILGYLRWTYLSQSSWLLDRLWKALTWLVGLLGWHVLVSNQFDAVIPYHNSAGMQKYRLVYVLSVLFASFPTTFNTVGLSFMSSITRSLPRFSSTIVLLKERKIKSQDQRLYLCRHFRPVNFLPLVAATIQYVAFLEFINH